MKRIILLLVLTLTSVYAGAGAHALYDYSSSSYVVHNDRHKVRSIASITKLFTAIAVINSGVDLNEKVKINGKSRGKVPPGSYMTRMDLMRAMLISSDNRASETLANHHPGGFTQFIKDVNLYISDHSLHNTKIVDSTGLLADNVSTAHELIEVLGLVRNQPIIRSIAGERNALITTPAGKRTIRVNLNNTNPEIFTYDNILISKTGFTTPAGRCVLMLVEKNTELYAVVVLGQPSTRKRSILVKELLNVDVPVLPETKINSTVEFDFSNTK
jgi:D-alanyl-D-alanine endopeptidase (penicillin-binding protein 7)